MRAAPPVIDRMAAGQVEVWRTRVPCVCSTPFGSAVEPEVCTMTARSAGQTSASSAASSSCDTLATSAVIPPRRPAPGEVAGENDASQVRRRAQDEVRGALVLQVGQRGFEPFGDIDVEHAGRGDQDPDIG